MNYNQLTLILSFGLILCHVEYSSASETNNVNSSSEKIANSSAPVEKQPIVSSLQTTPFFPTELSLKSGLGQSLIYIGVAAFSFVLVGGLTLLIAPLFGYKICTILGNCDPISSPYSGGTLQNAGQLNSFPAADLYGALYSNSPYAGYKKRSLEHYIKPIIQTLASAYEKKSE